ncbi:unnamed protein product [Linum tenue]|uniref:Uncharacterized protein n=1 Tax=Linum tenue TaxID=586396 RepID=A0AAV0HWE8_9ROSI|nr:unnamed protein product [Linum tenue]
MSALDKFSGSISADWGENEEADRGERWWRREIAKQKNKKSPVFFCFLSNLEGWVKQYPTPPLPLTSSLYNASETGEILLEPVLPPFSFPFPPFPSQRNRG